MAVEILVGMRWQHLWRLARKPWVTRSFIDMLRVDGSTGLDRSWITVTRHGPAVVQRWRTGAHLDRWARDHHGEHAGPWARFAREEGRIGDWGIWHERSTG